MWLRVQIQHLVQIQNFFWGVNGIVLIDLLSILLFVCYLLLSTFLAMFVNLAGKKCNHVKAKEYGNSLILLCLSHVCRSLQINNLYIHVHIIRKCKYILFSRYHLYSPFYQFSGRIMVFFYFTDVKIDIVRHFLYKNVERVL